MMRTRLQAVLLESFIDSWRAGGSRAWCSTATDRTRSTGASRGPLLPRYYGHYCFLPLYITCGGRPLFAQLRPGNADPAGGVTGPLGRIVERLRERWPGLEILLRADASYAREEILAWCEGNGVDYVIGLARNSRLVETDRLGVWPTPRRRRSGGAAQPAGSMSSSTPHSQAGPASASAVAKAVASCPARPTRASWSPQTARHLLGPDRLRARLLPEGQHAEHDQGAAARSLLRPDLGVALRRQPAPDPLQPAFASILFVAIQACAARHPPTSRIATAGTLRLKHRSRSAPASRSRCYEGSRSPWTPHSEHVRRRLRTRPRPIARVTAPHPLRDTRSSRSSVGTTAPQDRKSSLRQRFPLLWPPENTAAEPLASAPPAPPAETRLQRCPQSPQR